MSNPFKTWKRWVRLGSLDAGFLRTHLWLNNEPGRDVLHEVALRAEADDKKMRDVFDAQMRLHLLEHGPASKQTEGWDSYEDAYDKLTVQLYEACERARQ